jgi:hypothetical protein
MTLVGKLFSDWKAYAIDAGIAAGTSKAFSQAFRKAGFTRYRSNGKRYFDKVRLRLAESEASPFD